MEVISDSLTNIYSSSIYLIASYSAKLIAGLILLLIGVVVASLVKDLIFIIFRYFKVGKWLETAGVAKEKEVKIWPNLLAEIIRWSIIFMFLMSSVEIWGIPKVGEVINQILGFLPNVFVAVIVGLLGLVAGRFAYDIVRHAVSGLGERESLVLGTAAKYAIIFFTILVILTELGVAADLVRILFTGIIAMLALAFGLSFGLGGQDEARDILKGFRKKLQEKTLEKKGRGVKRKVNKRKT